MPIRTCVGCRETAEKSELIRLVDADGRVVVDATQTRPGRGVYLHPGRPDCLDTALKRRAIPRGLRASGISLAGLREALDRPGDPV